jgi:putative membrane protein
MTVQNLPALNATLNGLSALLLLAGWVCIRRGHRTAHRNCMVMALGTSTLFLASYLTYHYFSHTVTRFVEPAWFRPIYLTILLTHTVLAVVILPLIAMTVFRAAWGQFDRHKRIARWTLPLWMYVSVTGVVIYLLLYQKFPQS